MARKENDNNDADALRGKKKVSKPEPQVTNTAADTAPFPLKPKPLKHPKGTVIVDPPYIPHPNDTDYWKSRMDEQTRR